MATQIENGVYDVRDQAGEVGKMALLVTDGMVTILSIANGGNRWNARALPPMPVNDNVVATIVGRSALQVVG